MFNFKSDNDMLESSQIIRKTFYKVFGMIFDKFLIKFILEFCRKHLLIFLFFFQL